MARDRHFLGRPWGLIVVVLYKLVWGLGEVVVGLALLASTSIIRGELAEDPQDILVNWLLHHASLTAETSVHLGTVLMGLGILKLIIAVGLWFRSWAMRRWMMGFVSLIAVFAAGDMLVQPSLIKALTLAAEIFILLYVWKVLPRHIPRHSEAANPHLI